MCMCVSIDTNLDVLSWSASRSSCSYPTNALRISLSIYAYSIGNFENYQIKKITNNKREDVEQRRRLRFIEPCHASVGGAALRRSVLRRRLPFAFAFKDHGRGRRSGCFIDSLVLNDLLVPLREFCHYR